MSSSKRTKHIKAKYFFITDKIEQGEVKIEHLPTERMWIDVNTKPKQGTMSWISTHTINSHINTLDSRESTLSYVVSD